MSRKGSTYIQELWDRPFKGEVEGISNTPPGSPSAKEKHIVGSSPTGDFVGHSNELATWIAEDDEWEFQTPAVGWIVLNKNDAGSRIFYRYVSGGWISDPALHPQSLTTYSYGGEDTNASPPGHQYLIANGKSTETALGSLTSVAEHVMAFGGRIVRIAVRMSESTVSDQVDFSIFKNGSVDTNLQLANAQQKQVLIPSGGISVASGDSIAIGVRGTGDAPEQLMVDVVVDQFNV